jgi:Stage II sporulation protein E (SpoIIE)
MQFVNRRGLVVRKKEQMTDLLKTAIEAHGCPDHWNQFTTVTAHLAQRGAFWVLKGRQGVPDDVFVTASLHEGRVSHRPSGGPGRRSARTPGHITTKDQRRPRGQRPSPDAGRSHVSDRADDVRSRLAIFGISLPSGAREGGDWADIFARTDRPGTVLTIGDAMGHGKSAVRLQRQLRRAAHGLLPGRPSEVTRVIEHLDRIASRRDAVATYLVASIDFSARRLSVCRAGHLPPVIIDHRGRSAFASAPTAGPLGLGRAAAPPSHILLAGGSTVVLYTDGLVESRSLSLGKGLARLRSAAAGTHTIPVEDLTRRLLDVRGAASPADDDVTVLVIRLPLDGDSASPDKPMQKSLPGDVVGAGRGPALLRSLE